MLALKFLSALLKADISFMLQHTVSVINLHTSYANDLSLVIGQMGFSLHLNAHNINYRAVIDGYAYGETAKLNLIASPEMSKAYSVPEKTRGGGGPDREPGIEPSSPSRPRQTPDWNGANRLVAVLPYDTDSVVTLFRWAQPVVRPHPERDGLKALSPIYWIIHIVARWNSRPPYGSTSQLYHLILTMTPCMWKGILVVNKPRVNYHPTLKFPSFQHTVLVLRPAVTCKTEDNAPDYFFFMADIFTCHNRRSTGETYNTNDGYINCPSKPGQWAGKPKWSAVFNNVTDYISIVFFLL